MTMVYTELKPIKTTTDLLANDESIDIMVCGVALADPGKTKLAQVGAHDPTPTPYFILDELFSYYEFDGHSHLLDVGCGLGRVLSHFVRGGYPGRATGVELDETLASAAQRWTAACSHVDVFHGDVLDLDLNAYTDFYLFNPFDANILVKFIVQIEQQVVHPVTVVHMSDNGDTWNYVGRFGWSELASGEYAHYLNASGHPVPVYAHGQHYTVWRFDPSLA